MRSQPACQAAIKLSCFRLLLILRRGRPCTLPAARSRKIPSTTRMARGMSISRRGSRSLSMSAMTSLRLRGMGKDHLERGALARLAADLDLSLDELKVFLDDRQPQADSLGGVSGADLMISFENLRQLFGRDASAGVLHHQRDGSGGWPVLDPDAHFSFSGVLEGVHDQVAQDRFDFSAVGRKDRKIGLYVPDDLEPAFPLQLGDQRFQRFEDLVDDHRGDIQRDGPRPDPREVQQIVEHSEKCLALVLNLAHGPFLLFGQSSGGPHVDDLQEPGDDGQRGLKLVREAGKELRTLLVRLFEITIKPLKLLEEERVVYGHRGFRGQLLEKEDGPSGEV